MAPAMFDPADAPDPERVYLNYLETCRRLGVEPVPRERADGLMQWPLAGKLHGDTDRLQLAGSRRSGATAYDP